MSGPVAGHRKRAITFRALLACLALITLNKSPAAAQTVTSDLFRPVRDGFLPPQNSPLRKVNDKTGDNATDPTDAVNGDPLGDDNTPAPSRIGNTPTYGLPAANGASDSGFDSLNRTRKQPKFYPGQAKPKPPPGPGTPAPVTGAPSTSNGRVRIAIPPSETANKTPLPPAMAGTVVGQPERKRLKIDDDPFGAVGDYAGSFLVKSAVELRGGYETNPGRLPIEKGLPFWVVAPEFLAVSDWERHALVADLRGSYTGYGGTLPATFDGAASPSPTNIDRPNFNGHVDGRIDVTENTHLLAEARLLLSTDNPGSPNIQAGLARYPVYTSFGGTFGLDQKFNRLEISAGATIDRTVYQDSTLTDGTTSTNDDRNLNQYGGVCR